MRKSILILICLLCASPCVAQEQYARMSAPMLGAGVAAVAAPACDTVSEESTGETGATLSVGQYENSLRRSNKFTSASASPMCKFVVKMSYVGTPGARTLKGCLYADSSGKPDGSTGIACSSAVAESVLFAGTDERDITFTFDAEKADATVYHLVIERNSDDSTNYPSWSYITGYVANNMWTWSGTEWTSSTSVIARFVNYE